LHFHGFHCKGFYSWYSAFTVVGRQIVILGIMSLIKLYYVVELVHSNVEVYLDASRRRIITIIMLWNSCCVSGGILGLYLSHLPVSRINSFTVQPRIGKPFEFEFESKLEETKEEPLLDLV
jgi:hypothetical protein